MSVKIKKIKYKYVTRADLCLTKCPFNEKFNGEYRAVGSWLCGVCKYFISDDRRKHIVECKHAKIKESKINVCRTTDIRRPTESGYQRIILTIPLKGG